MAQWLTLLEAQMWNPFYGWTSVLHKSVQVCCKRFLLHLWRMRPHVFLTFSHGVVDLNDRRRVLRRQEIRMNKTQTKKKKCHPRFGPKLGWLERLHWRRTSFYSWRGLSQMSKDDTDGNLSVRKCWNETSKSEGKVLPLLSLDNRYTSCLRRKQQTCGVFGLDLSVTGIEKPTF